MMDWTKVAPIVISAFAWWTSHRAYRLATEVQEENKERQERLENYDYYPRIYVDLQVDREGRLSALIRNESSQLPCKAGHITAELALYSTALNINDREVLEVDSIAADSTYHGELTRMSTRIKNAIPSIRQDTLEDFPGEKGQLSIRIVCKYEGPVRASQNRYAYALFFLRVNSDNSIVVAKREER
jgi:hypothetical protein